MLKKKFLLVIIREGLIVFCLSLMSLMSNAKSAETVEFASGIFRRSVTVQEIEVLAKTGKAEGILKKVIKSNDEKSNEIMSILNQDFEFNLTLTSKLINSKIGEVVIRRVAKIIYPSKIRSESVSVPAIRAGIINGLVLGKGKVNIVLFLKAYPNKAMTINVPALLSVLEKVESISELVEFFSDSPLEGLRNAKPLPLN